MTPSGKTPRRIDYTKRFLLVIPVETQRGRRTLVIGYYLFFLAFGIVLLWLRGADKYDRLLPLSFYMATMLGGLTFSGPVRVFSQWQRYFAGGAQRRGQPTYSLSGYASSRPDPANRLDEHDIARRDRAHYLAYSALRWPAILAALVGGLFLMDWPVAKVAHVLFILSVPVAVLFFSLPQAILLWTEPDLDPDPVAQPQPAAVRTLP